MSLNPTFLKKIVLLSAVVTLFSAASSNSSTAPTRLDLYDASNNHLMYVEFIYDGDGRNIGRTVYMSDGTFMRDVVIEYDVDGRRSNEVSYNFNNDPALNEDTSFVTNYVHTETTTSFSIVDQFEMDQVGGRVVYSKTNPTNFGLVYENTGAQAASVAYTNDAAGDLQRVDITDQSGKDTYYGLFTNGSAVRQRTAGNQRKPQAVVIPRGSSQLDVLFNLRSAGEVRCELLSLSGRRVAVLFQGKMQQGSYTRRIRFDGASHNRVATGVYLFRVLVDGVTVSSSRYLHQYSTVGGVR